MSANPIMPSNFDAEPAWRTVVEFALPAAADSTDWAVGQVMAAVREFQLSSARLEQLAAALVEVLRNASRQDDRLQPQLPPQIKVSVAALADRDAACCWGFFVIARAADRLSATDGPAHHAIELCLYQERPLPRV